MPPAERGPGKYDAACTKALVETKAKVAILIVFGGEHGSGFSVNSVSPADELQLPKLLRDLADMIEGVH